MNIKELMDNPKSMALNRCWKNLWPEAADDLQGFPSQRHEIRNVLMLTCEVFRRVQDLEEADIQEFLSSYSNELIDEGLEWLTALIEPEGEEDSGIVEEDRAIEHHVFLH
jgi:hypothetical protein